MLRRFSHLICRSSQAASSLFQATRRWIRALLGPQIQWHEVLVLFIGFLGLVAAQIDMIRDFFPVHTLIKIDAWTGTAFGVVSASFVYKAWWHLLNSGDDKDKIKDGAISAMMGVLFLVIALSYGVELPFI